ncbi:MAG: autotransporter-associated beta strand repeat-containing protein [Rhodospirillales bacterium]|nr:autotransporter-associated beta strand repeat-containing protein [Rhodospirillales bacterium]
MAYISVRRRPRRLVALLLAGTCLSPIGAAAQTWIGGTGTDFATGANWSTGTAPTDFQTGTFGASSNTTVTMTTGLQAYGGIAFTAAAPSYSFDVNLNGSGTSFGASGITNASSNAQNFTLTNVANFAVLGGTTNNVNFSLNNGVLRYAETSNLGNSTVSMTGASTLLLQTTGSGGTAAVTSTGGVIDITLLTTAGTTLGSIAGSASVQLGSKTLTVGGNNQTTAHSGAIQGSGGSLVKEGTGTLTLSGINTYSGGTTISGGALSISSNANLGNAAGGLTLDSGTLRTTASFATSRTTTLAGTATFDTASSTTLTHNGTIGGTPTGFVKTGAGTLTLTGVNTYTGGTTVTGGLINFSAGTNLGTGSITLNGGGLQWATGNTTDISSRLAALGAGGGTFDTNGNNVTLASVLSGGVLTKKGSGTLTLTGVNTYTGGTTVTGGLVNFSAGNNLGTGSITLNGGGLQWASGNTTDISSRLAALGAGGGTFDTNGNNVTLASVISGGALTKTGSGTLTLTAENTYTGTTTVSGGTLQVGNGGNTGTLGSGAVINNAQLTFNRFDVLTVANDISGSGAVTVTGGGIVTFSGTNSYGGGTTVSSGTLVGTTTSLQGAIINNANVRFSQVGNGIYAGNMSGSGAVAVTGAGTVTFLGTNSYGGGTTVSAGITLQGTTTSLQGAITNNANVVFSQAGNGTYAGTMSGSGAVTVTGGGIVTFSGTNSYGGGTTVSGGSTLVGTTGSLQGAIVNNAQVVFSQAGTGTYAGTMSGSGGVVLNGTGTVTFSGTNSYGGGTTVLLGTLQGTTSSLQGDIANNANVTFNQATTGTYAGNMSGTGAVTVTGGGTVTFSGTNSYGGGTTVSGVGTTLVGTTTSLQGAITNNASVRFDQAGTSTYAGNMSGTGAVAVQGGGTVTFSGTNSYTGGTTVVGGALSVSSDANLGDAAGGLALSNGALQTTASFTTSRTTTLSGGAFNTAAGTTLTHNGTIGGSGFIKSGGGTMVLGGANTFASAAVSGGTLQVSADNNLGAGGVVLNGGTLQTTASFTRSGNVLLASGGGTFNTDAGTTFAVGGDVGGVGSLIKTGAGTLILTGANSYIGGTTVSGGILQGTTTSLQGNILNNAAVTFDQGANGTYGGGMSGSGDVTVQGGGTVTFTGTNSYRGGTTVSGGTLAGTTSSLQGNIVNNANVTFDQSTNGTYAGTMSGTGSLTKSGTGTVTLTGANTYGGGTTISGGILQIGNGGTTGSIAGNVLNNGTLAFNRSDAITFGGTISGSGALDKLGNGTLILTADNTYSGVTTIAAGTLQLGNGGTTGSIAGNVLNNGILAFNRSDDIVFGGNIDGSGAIAYMGPGTVTLTGTITNTGGTVLAGGTVEAGSNSALGAAGATLTFAGGTLQATASFSVDRPVNLITGGGTIDTAGNSLTVTGNLTGAGGLTKTGTGTLILSGINGYTGGTTVSGGVLQGTTASVQGDILNNANVTLDQATAGTYAGNMSGTGSLTIQGGGTVTLSGTNSYSGGTSVLAGTLIGTTSSLQGAIDNNASVVFSQAANGTYAGNMSGTGGVVLNGAGTVTFLGTNSYSGGTSVLSGVLQGTTTSLQGNILNNASVVFGQSGSGSYAGSMSGTGSLTLLGGTVTLTGTNTYSGGTTVSGGILQGTTTSLQGNILNNSSVVFDQAANGTYAGNMSGTGMLTKSGAGTLILGGSNSYTGGTLVSGGLLQGTTSSIQGIILNNASVAFNQSTTGTYAGDMFGTGSLLTNGTGTVILSGTNGYTGGTTVSGGVLQGNSASLQGGILNNASVVFNQTGSGTYAGNMSGTGSMTLQGGGVLAMTGNNTYTGPTTVNASTLVVNGSLASTVTLNNGSTIGGNGTIGGLVSSGATIAPGNSIGTLNITGNFSQSGGSYVVEANAAGQSDRVNVTGAATINGATVQVAAASGNYANSTTYTILNAAGGVSGTYSGVTSNFAFLTPSLSYNANNVFLTLALQGAAFSGFSGNTGNQRGVGSALDQSYATATGDFATVIGALAGLNTQQAPYALNQISGQPYADFGTANLASNTLFMNALGQQMAMARGSAGTGQRQALAQACEVEACDGASPFSVWGSALGGFGSVQGDGSSNTFTYNLGGAAAGIDYRVLPSLLLGIGAGYTSGTQWADTFQGKGWTNAVSVAAYASFTQSGFYADLLAGYAYSNNQLQRQISIPGLQPRTANGSTGANQFLGQVELGYQVPVYAPAAATITPFARLQVMSVNQAAFNEWGADSLSLNVQQQTTNSMRSTLGAQLNGAIGLGDTRTLDLALRLGWLHDYSYTGRPITAAFAGAPANAFTVYGAAPQRDAAAIGFQASTNVATATQIYFRYDGDIGSGTDNHALNVGLRLQW